MLIPITRDSFEQVVPLIATWQQYLYYWGKVNDFLRRSLISFVIVIVLLIFGSFLGKNGEQLILLLQIVGGLYWFWSPIYLASIRNSNCRRFAYTGFLRCKILDVFITEELVKEVERINQKGQLIIVENREKKLNLEIADKTGFKATIKSPLNRLHKVIKAGEMTELIILSNQPDLGNIKQISDAYLPRYNLWIGDYPYLRRDAFLRLREDLKEAYNQRKRVRKRR
jgi:hypothetical protein